MKIRKQALLSLCSALFLLFLSSGLIFRQFQVFTGQTEDLQRLQALQIHLSQLHLTANKQVLMGINLLRTEDISGDNIVPYRMMESRLISDIRKLKSYLGQWQELDSRLNRIMDISTELSEKCKDEILSPLYAHQSIDSEDMEELIFRNLEDLQKEMNFSMNQLEEYKRGAVSEQRLLSRRFLVLFIPLFSLLMILAQALAFRLIRRILKHLQLTQRNLADLAGGQGGLSVRLEISSRDEIGDLCQDFNAFMDKLCERNAVLQDISGRNMDAGDSLKNLTGEHSSAILQLKQSLEQLSLLSQSMGKGVHLSGQELTRIIDALDLLERMSSEQTSKARELENQGEEVRSAMLKQEDILQNQVYLIENVKKEGLRTGQLFSKLQEQIQAFGEETKTINQAICDIDDLANQTDILAINASIQAAHAGDFGKRFAVVTKEMHRLSARVRKITESVNQWLLSFSSRLQEISREEKENQKSMERLLHQNHQAESSIHQLRDTMQQISGQVDGFREFLSLGLEGAEQLYSLSNRLRDHGGRIDFNMQNLLQNQDHLQREWEEMHQGLQLLHRGTLSLEHLSRENHRSAQTLEEEILKIRE